MTDGGTTSLYIQAQPAPANEVNCKPRTLSGHHEVEVFQAVPVSQTSSSLFFVCHFNLYTIFHAGNRLPFNLETGIGSVCAARPGALKVRAQNGRGHGLSYPLILSSRPGMPVTARCILSCIAAPCSKTYSFSHSTTRRHTYCHCSLLALTSHESVDCSVDRYCGFCPCSLTSHTVSARHIEPQTARIF